MFGQEANHAKKHTEDSKKASENVGGKNIWMIETCEFKKGELDLRLAKALAYIIMEEIWLVPSIRTILSSDK